MVVPRLLWMLANDDDDQTLAKTLAELGQQLPPAVWIPWLPQLVTSLLRPEAKHVRVLLDQVLTKYPQALYYSLRALLLERREYETSVGGAEVAQKAAEKAKAKGPNRLTDKFAVESRLAKEQAGCILHYKQTLAMHQNVERSRGFGREDRQ